MSPSSTRFVAPIQSTPAGAAVAPPFLPLLARPVTAANRNGHSADEALDRREIVGLLYKKHFDSLLRVALRRVDDIADAKDAIQEAVLILMTSPNRKPTRGALFAVMRSVCSERNVVLAADDEYVDDRCDEDYESAAGWLTRALSG
jgi:hypothetical protein